MKRSFLLTLCFLLGLILALLLGFNLAHCETPNAEIQKAFDVGRAYQLGFTMGILELPYHCDALKNPTKRSFAFPYGDKERLLLVDECDRGFLDGTKERIRSKIQHESNQDPRLGPKFYF